MHLVNRDSIFLLLSSFVLLEASGPSDTPIWTEETPVLVKREEPGRAGIVRGENVKLGSWKWQAYIELGNGQNRCGGMVLNEYWVLTAAHCFNWYKPTKVITGSRDLKTLDVGAISSTVANITCHEGYNSATFLHDICLIKLSAPLTLGGNIAKVPLPLNTSRPIPDARCKVAGWGLNEFGLLPNILQEATVTVFEQTICQERYGSFLIPESHFCAGNPVSGPGQDTCGGDSGGPLACMVNNVQVLYGITSFGPKNCGNDRRPGAYTRVVDYLQWIEDKTETYQWGPWSDSPCSVTCGTGIKKIERKCHNSRGQIMSDISKCSPGVAVKEEVCTKAECIIYQWGPWGDSPCSVTCGTGIKRIERKCHDNRGQIMSDISKCSPGVSVKDETCSKAECIFYHWAAWSPSPCSVTCGNGIRWQTRRCLDKNDYITEDENCQQGSHQRNIPCYGGDCIGFNANFGQKFWSEWSDWSACSTVCGGSLSRSRACLSLVPSIGIYKVDSYFCELFTGEQEEETLPCPSSHC